MSDKPTAWSLWAASGTSKSFGEWTPTPEQQAYLDATFGSASTPPTSTQPDASTPRCVHGNTPERCSWIGCVHWVKPPAWNDEVPR